MRHRRQLHLKTTDGGVYEPQGMHDTLVDAAQASAIPDLSQWNVGGDPENRYVDTVEASWLITQERIPESDADRIELAVELGLKLGGCSGGHHKTWVIDQMIRLLAGDRYEALVADRYWSVGVAP
jgi:hypothetical protein